LNQEFCQFLYIAKGSCGEVRAQLYIALDQNYMSNAEVDQLTNSYKRLSSMISNFIAYRKNSGMKGEKFREPEGWDSRNGNPITGTSMTIK
jgi:hypothetical protein